MSNERKYFDADKLIHRLYSKIAIWHNNEDRLNDVEMGRELKFLCKDITNDVLVTVLGSSDIKVDTDLVNENSSKEGEE
jgi:hypothetical protein